MTTTDSQHGLEQKLARPPKELLSSTSFLLKRLGWEIKDRAMEAFESTGLTPQHHAVLSVLEEGAPETQGTIADALGYDRSHIVRLLDELEERELVLRKRDPESGIRELEALDELAAAQGLRLAADHAMPANNQLLVWRRDP